MANITLAVTGSIAAYKAADLVSALTKLNQEVTVLMTKAATEFITPLTLQVLSKHKVQLEIMDEARPELVNHIALAKATDLFIVAPATADTIRRLAQGAANDIVTAVALALPDDSKKMLAPAMNAQMYQNPLTQRNLAILKEVGFEEIAPKEALLACGDYGRGALADVDAIVQAIMRKLEE